MSNLPVRWMSKPRPITSPGLLPALLLVVVAAVGVLIVRPAAAQFLPPGIVNPFADIDPGDDLFASHVIEDDGTMHVVWATQNPYIPASGTDPDIYYSRNDGGGWTTPEIVNPWALSDTAVDERPRLAVDSAGVVHCVWQSQYDASGAGTDWDVFYRSLDPVAGWGSAVPVNSDALTDNTDIDFFDAVPTIAVDGNDSVLVLYQAQAGSYRQFLHWRVLSGTGWSTDLKLADDSLGPAAMAVTDDGSVVVAWEYKANPSANVVIQTSTYVGVGWSANIALTSSTVNSIHPTVTTYGSGTRLEKHFVWATDDDTGGLGTDWDLKHYVRLAEYPWIFGPFTVNSTAATDGAADDARPSLCVEPGGVIHVVWQSTVDIFTGADFDVYHSENGSRGSEWSAIGLLGLNAPFDSPGEDDADPEIRCTSNHILSAMWNSRDDLGGTIGNDRDIFHALGLGRVYHRPLPAAAWAISDSDPDSRVDTAEYGGVFHMVWESANSGGFLSTGSDYDIYHVAYKGGFFQPQQLVNTSGNIDAGDDHAPAIAIDRTGNLHVVFSSETDIGGTVGTDADIFYTKYDGSAWSTPELVNLAGTSDSIDDLDPRVAVAPDGELYAVWSSSYDGGGAGSDTDIYIAKRDADPLKATSTWQGSFLLINHFGTDSGEDTAPDLAVDNETIDVAWVSDAGLGFGAAGTDKDIFHVRVPRTSALPADIAVGVANPNAFGDTGSDNGVSLAAVPGGAVFLAWQSTDNLGTDVGTDLDIIFGRLGEEEVIFSDGFETSNILRWSNAP
ncbi:MAG: hypothetical protein QNL88_00640 [Acidobacteriota bacterium]|nr:hypothetical protein [Acidobacteriota bacterium]